MKKTIVVPLLTLFVAAGALGCGGEEPPAPGETEVGAPDPADVEPVEAPGPGQAGAVLEVDTLETVGPYLTDRDGRALYLLVADSAGMSNCYGACTDVWPPLIAEAGTPVAADPPVIPALIGTIERRTGAIQVTYNGWPLYYYVQDRGDGEATGQDVHDEWGEWYLVHPEGHPLEEG